MNAKPTAVFVWLAVAMSGATGAGSANFQGAFAASHMTRTAYTTHGTGQWV